MKSFCLVIWLFASVCKIHAGDPLKIRTWQADLGITFLGKSESNTNLMLNTGFNYVFPETPVYLGVTNDIYYRTQYPEWPGLGRYKQTNLINTLNICGGFRLMRSKRISLVIGLDYQILNIKTTTKTDHSLIKSYLADDLSVSKNMLSYYLRTDVKIDEHFSAFLSHHIIQIERPFFSYLTLGINYNK